VVSNSEVLWSNKHNGEKCFILHHFLRTQTWLQYINLFKVYTLIKSTLNGLVLQLSFQMLIFFKKHSWVLCTFDIPLNGKDYYMITLRYLYVHVHWICKLHKNHYNKEIHYRILKFPTKPLFLLLKKTLMALIYDFWTLYPALPHDIWFDVSQWSQIKIHHWLKRYRFWCTRCAFRLIKSLQWYQGRKSWKFEKLWKM
jgi:hypothetical protein